MSASTEAAPSASQWLKEFSAAPTTAPAAAPMGLGRAWISPPTVLQTASRPGTMQVPPPVEVGEGIGATIEVGLGCGGGDAARAEGASARSARTTTGTTMSLLPIGRPRLGSRRIGEIPRQLRPAVEEKGC